jgi:hypothetical protein
MDRMRLVLSRMTPVLMARNSLTSQKSTAREEIERDELLRYFPIAIVACLEGYFQLVYRDLIDAGQPYLGNAMKALKDLKFGVDVVLQVHGRRITAGELLAHQLKHNKLLDIDANMSHLTGRSFFSELKQKKLLESAFKDEDWARVYPKWYQLLEKTFELRHIFCHELATREKLKVAEISDSCDATVGLIFATEGYLADLIPRPNR